MNADTNKMEDHYMRARGPASVFTLAVLQNASASEAASQLPSEQEVLTFAGDTIGWHVPASQRIGPAVRTKLGAAAQGPSDRFLSIGDERNNARPVCRLSTKRLANFGGYDFDDGVRRLVSSDPVERLSCVGAG